MTLTLIMSSEAAPDGHIRRESGASEGSQTVRDGAGRDGGDWPPTTAVVADDRHLRLSGHKTGS